MRALIALVAIAAPLTARAQPAADDAAPDAPAPQAPTPAPEPPPAPPAPPPSDGPTTQELSDQIDQLEQELRQTQAHQARTDGMIAKVETALRRYITAFLDVGAFATGGNGAGIRSDYGHFYYPKYDGRIAGQWTFMGDPLATAINSLGEPADTANSRAIKTDTIHSGGRPSVIVNSLGLAIGRTLSDGISMAALAELLPRPAGNILDVEYAEIRWRPLTSYDLELRAGKVDSVLGVEYRSQDANKRLGVTPSLICRYTCGRPFGIEARLVRGPLSLSAALTDRDSFDARFEPSPTFASSYLPTAAWHVQYLVPVGQSLELGFSGAIGPQTGQSDLDVAQWHIGFDANLINFHGFDATAEYVQGLEQGKTTTITPCNAAPCLQYKGAYLLMSRRVNNWLLPYVRVDWRDAVHQNGVEFVYESHTARATVGAHFDVSSRIIAKVEYTFVRELDVIPEFPDDVLTSSLVVVTD